MKCNIAQARPRPPREWERLPDRDKHIIIQYLKDKVMEDRDEWLDAQNNKIFGKGGYLHEWVDSLERREK